MIAAGQWKRPWRGALVALLGLGLVLFLGRAAPVLAVSPELLGDFAAGHYSLARDLVGASGTGQTSSSQQLLNLLLTPVPEQASVLLQTLEKAGAHRDGWKIRWALESADLAFAQEEFGLALQELKPWTQSDESGIPGQVFLRAGLSCRGLGLMQRAREMLASVKPGDEAFPLARYYLGDISLEQGYPQLALRYFQNAAQAGGGAYRSMIDGGTCRALQVLGRDAAADSLRGLYQNGLSWLDSRPGMVLPTAADSVSVAPPAPPRARFCLQLGAFHDRSLALGLVGKHTRDIPNLHIESAPDAAGQTLYRVRCGAYNNPEDARAAARDLHDRFGLEVIVKDTQDSGPEAPSGG